MEVKKESNIQNPNEKAIPNPKKIIRDDNKKHLELVSQIKKGAKKNG